MNTVNIRSMRTIGIGLTVLAVLMLFFLLAGALADDEEAWFKYKNLTLSGSEDNGLNDTVRITYDVDTKEGQTFKGGVGYEVYDSSGSKVNELGNWINVTGNESDEGFTAFTLFWLDTPRSDNYTLKIFIYDENWTEIHQQEHNVTLEVAEEAWFVSKDYIVNGDSVEFTCDIDTRGDWTQNGTVLVKIRNENWDLVDTLEIPFDVTGDEADPFTFDWTAPESGTYDIEITINNETRCLHFQYHTIELSVPDEMAWFGTKDHWLEDRKYAGFNDTVVFEFDIDTKDNHTQEGLISIEIQNSTGATLWQNSPGIPFTVTGSEEDDLINWNWTAGKTDNYTVIIKLLNGTGETVLHEQSHTFWFGEMFGDIWSNVSSSRLEDLNADGEDDSVFCDFEIDTQVGWTQECFFQSEVLDSSFFIVETTTWSFQIVGGTPQHIMWNWSADKNDTYTINLTVIDIYEELIAGIFIEDIYLATAQDPTPECPGDVVLYEVQMQAVQVVWHDDPDWGVNIRQSHTITKGDIPLVKDKRTLAFGTHTDYDFSTGTIDLRVHNYFSFDKEVRVEFRLFPPVGSSVRIHLTNKTYWIPRSTPTPDCNQPGTRWISIAAPVPTDGFFEPDQEGWWKLEAEVVNPDGSPIMDTNPENQDGHHTFWVVDTHGLKILAMPAIFRDTDKSSIDLSVPYDEVGKFIFGVYPVDEEESGLDYGFLDRLLLQDGATSIKNLSEWESLNEKQRIRHFNRLSASYAGAAWLTGYDRLVLFTEPGFLEMYGGAVGLFCQSNKQVSYVSLTESDKAPGSVTAHELGHSYGLWLGGLEEYTDGVEGNNNGSGRDANGYWVSEHEYRDRKFCFMGFAGSSDYNRWIDKPDYRKLLDRFAYAEDPEILGVRFLMHSNDTVEPLSWLRIPEGNIDLNGTEEGTHSIILKDGTGMEIVRYRFNVSFILQVEPIGAIEVDVVPVTFRIPWHEGTKTLEIVNLSSGKILLTREVSDSSPQVKVLSPAEGEVLTQGVNEIRWEATDAEGGTLHHIVLISADGGANWIPLASLDDLTVAMWDSSQWPAGDAYRIKIVTSDGVNTGFAESNNFTLRIGGEGDDDDDDGGGILPFPGAIITFVVLVTSGLAAYFRKRK